MELSMFFLGLPTAAPVLVGWLVAVILAAIIVSRGGSAPEKLILSGFSIMLSRTILGIPIVGISSIVPYLADKYGLSLAEISLFFSITNFSLGFISLAGIICLIIGFWLGFRARRVQQVP